jgi:MarR family transcriptional regulator, organic hydroperoxide resistance regulator
VREEATVSWCPGGNDLDQELFDAMTEFVTQLIQRGERLADRFSVPVSCMKAIRRLDAAVTMKDLGQRLHCDPSFVTMIADALEQRGLAKREANPADRRIKNLVLTPSGLEIKATIEQEMLKEMPWTQALSVDEREQFLRLVRKMNEALASTPAVEEVTASTALPLIS